VGVLAEIAREFRGVQHSALARLHAGSDGSRRRASSVDGTIPGLPWNFTRSVKVSQPSTVAASCAPTKQTARGGMRSARS
jgi:hypothetical protein